VKLLHKNAQTGKNIAKTAGISAKINAAFIFSAGLCGLGCKKPKGMLAQKRKDAGIGCGFRVWSLGLLPRFVIADQS
jgi:hypothetical protein